MYVKEVTSCLRGCLLGCPPGLPAGRLPWPPGCTLNLPTNITPTNIASGKLSGKFPMDMRITPLIIKIMHESNPLKSIM